MISRQRKPWLVLVALMALNLSLGCGSAESQDGLDSEGQWKEKIETLGPTAYHVTQERGTERAYSGEYWDHKAEGVYNCVICGTPLFGSETKYRSGTGWPSFWKPIDDSNIALQPDRRYSVPQTEVLCGTCGAHLGHVFDDGPDPTGKRYCINSVALQFEEAGRP
jgi:peptide-methionine (R)-S-oxide reductase